MKRTIAALSACLFAGAAFAQTTPAQAPSQTTTPDSSISPAVARAAAAHEKQAGEKPAAKADAKNKKSKGKASKKRKQDDGQVSKQDTTA
jgi:hypothetical protein